MFGLVQTCIILPGVKIEEGCVIAAGSVITKSIPKCAVVGGNPAKILKFRNIENYEKAKKSGLHPDTTYSSSDPIHKNIIINKFKKYMDINKNV